MTEVTGFRGVTEFYSCSIKLLAPQLASTAMDALELGSDSPTVYSPALLSRGPREEEELPNHVLKSLPAGIWSFSHSPGRPRSARLVPAETEWV